MRPSQRGLAEGCGGAVVMNEGGDAADEGGETESKYCREKGLSKGLPYGGVGSRQMELTV